MLKTDILVVGAGIIGLSIAREINSREPDAKILIIEKEPQPALHASGRNSGVLHAGFYYTPDSFKAKFSVEGNRMLTEYCLSNNLSINRCGKVVVAMNDKELEYLYELKSRGDKNGVTLDLIDEKQLNEIEPNAKTFKNALFSPTTSTVNPKEVVSRISSELISKKSITAIYNEGFIKRVKKSRLLTKNNEISCKYLINAAGLYADNVAGQFGAGENYILIPFKGLYMKYNDDTLIRRHIYPVPDKRYHFLGVHFTKTVDGGVKAGPTAIPALWRENYSGLSNFKFREFIDILLADARLYLNNSFNFRDLAHTEIRKYGKKKFIDDAALLTKSIDKSKFGDRLPAGIRAQLVDTRNYKLVNDFIMEHKDNSTHILNAVSPAFTCAFSFSRYVTDKVMERLDI